MPSVCADEHGPAAWNAQCVAVPENDGSCGAGKDCVAVHGRSDMSTRGKPLKNGQNPLILGIASMAIEATRTASNDALTFSMHISL